MSRVKGAPRLIFRSPASFPGEMRIAQTLEGEPDEPNVKIRETEILYRRSRDKKNWDFYAYDESGKLSTQSLFRNGPMPSPGVCMACHYSSADRAFVPILE